MARLAIAEADKRNLPINVAIGEAWERFEERRISLEQKLSGRIRAYEKQLTLAARQLQ
jgi:hypothetical protein